MYDCYKIGSRAELVKHAVIEMLFAVLDRTFAAEPGLAIHFPEAPAARDKLTASLRTDVADRLGCDCRSGIEETRSRTEFVNAPDYAIGEYIEPILHWYVDQKVRWHCILDGWYGDWLAEIYEERGGERGGQVALL